MVTPHDVRLVALLQTMDVPVARLNDYRWLIRNLGIQNSNHPDFAEALRLAMFMSKATGR